MVYSIFKVKGIYFHSTGDKYEGQWQDNKEHGIGTFIHYERHLYYC